MQSRPEPSRLPLLARAQSDPDAVALTDDRASWTWRELAEVTLRAAGALRATSGENRRVAVCAHNSAETVIAHAAGVLGEVTVVPINHHLKDDEVRFILVDSEVRVVLAGPETIELVRSAAAGLAGVEVVAWRTPGYAPAFEDWVEGAEPWSPDPDATPAPSLLYTSGTTGRPKACAAPSRMVGSTILANCDARRLSDKPHLVVGPLYHGGPINGAMHVLAGVAVIVPDRFDARAVLEAIERYSVGSSTMVPTHFKRLLVLPEDERHRFDVSSLETVAHTGAPCPVDVKLAMMEWWGPVLKDRYGGTESGTLCEIDAQDWYEHQGSVGRPRPDTEVVAIDDRGRLLPAGAVGTLHFRHPSREVPVYLGAPNPNARPDGYYTLGELGYVDASGYVFITDRGSDVVLSGGVNVYPAEAERVLLSDPGLADAVCIGVPHGDLGEELIALAITAPGAPIRTEEEVLARCREGLAHMKCPRRVEFVAVTGRNPMGKVNRREVRDLYLRGGAEAVARARS
ncbi:MAG TPA: AMP-binding protein [Acidimicrobiales bacterium]